MRKLFAALLLFPVLAWAQSPAATPDEELRKLAWQNGPTKGAIAGKASIKVPRESVFLDAGNTRRFLELNGNPPRDNHFMFGPKSLDWFAIFSFDASGYVKDDEKIDADALLNQLKDADEPGNEQRKSLGLPAIYTDGWQVPPHYDPDTKRLEWGLRLRTESGKPLVNYTSRVLGRTGVMSVVLVSEPDQLEQDIKAFKQAMAGFSYNGGETYAEFKQGDKVAQYGLAALVLGGAAAVATKKGFWGAIVAFFGAFWKLILGGLVALGAGFKSLFKPKAQ